MTKHAAPKWLINKFLIVCEAAYRRGYQQGIVAASNGITDPYGYPFDYRYCTSGKVAYLAAMHINELLPIIKKKPKIPLKEIHLHKVSGIYDETKTHYIFTKHN